MDEKIIELLETTNDHLEEIKSKIVLFVDADIKNTNRILANISNTLKDIDTNLHAIVIKQN